MKYLQGHAKLKDEKEKINKWMLTVMHVTVAFCGIQLDGLEEVPLCFCFLPLGATIEHSVIIVSIKKNKTNLTEKTKTCEYLWFPLQTSHPL